MCVICENYEIGDVLPDMPHKGTCPQCNNNFTVQLESPIWIEDRPHSRNGSLLHITHEPYICPKCKEYLALGFYCEGINGGDLFKKQPEHAEVEKQNLWEIIKTAFK
jgi:hypothetical protein